MDRQTKGLIVGGLLGALLGMLAAWLYMRTEAQRGPKAVPPGRVLRLGLAIMEALHQVATLGQPEEAKRRRGRLPL